MKKKTRTLIIIVVTAIVIAALVVAFLIWRMSRRESVRETLNLGNKYLSSLDFDGAAEQYSKALTIDPYNQEALQGLGISYAGSGNLEMSRQIMTDDMIAVTDPGMLRTYVDILSDAGDYQEAVHVMEYVLDAEDRDEDFTKYDEIVHKALEEPLGRSYPYAESQTVTVDISGGSVRTGGTNVLGALGTASNLGDAGANTGMTAAAFPGTAKSVFTTGSQSIVVDSGGHLWSAGSNRSGQKANQLATLIPEEGWTEETAIGSVAKVAGTGSTVFVLTTAGDLYVAGQNHGYVFGSSWLNHWTPVAAFGKIADIQYDGSSGIYVQTLSGRIYRADTYNFSTNSYVSSTIWSPVTKGAAAFSVGTNAFAVIDNSGLIPSEQFGNTLYPDEWVENDLDGNVIGTRPPFAVRQMACLEYCVYLLDSEGKVHFIKDRKETQVDIPESAAGIYTSAGSCVVRFEDGSYRLYDENGNEKS